MTVCGGFALGSITLGGSIVRLCKDCKPNLIIERLQELNNIGLNPNCLIRDKEL
jgi:hypothetical protein